MSLPHVVGLPRWTRSRLVFCTTVLINVYYVDDRQYYSQNASAKDTSVRFSGAATIEQYIVFVGARYKHVRCTNSKLRVLYTHDPPAK